jgi:hypothetical protein
MNFLIREKMFKYFYNKFRPVNCMHYIKSSVNILLLIFLAAADDPWHLVSLFYDNR